MTPGTRSTAAVTSLVRVSFSGQPETVSSTVTATLPASSIVDAVDHAELGDRAPDLGVVDRRERSLDLFENGEVMASSVRRGTVASPGGPHRVRHPRRPVLGLRLVLLEPLLELVQQLRSSERT